MTDNGRIIIVEDDVDLRDSLVEYLVFSGHTTVGVGSCLEFYRAITEFPCAIAVIDIMLPDQSGFVLTEYIRKNTSMGIIILTARDSVDDRLKGYDTGADLYLVKPVDCRELAAVITNLKKRLAENVPETATVANVWQLDRNLWQLVPPAGEPVFLTPKEMRFVACLAESVGSPIKRDELLKALDYRDDEYANRAMDSLVRRLRRKIEDITGGPNPIKTIHAVGYCFSAPLNFR